MKYDWSKFNPNQAALMSGLMVNETTTNPDYMQLPHGTFVDVLDVLPDDVTVVIRVHANGEYGFYDVRLLSTPDEVARRQVCTRYLPLVYYIGLMQKCLSIFC